jgi:hypothetical protein
MPVAEAVRSPGHRCGIRRAVLGVAAPPTGIDEAIRIAAEQFAFCPDNVWHGGATLVDYAQRLIDASTWSFWWE